MATDIIARAIGKSALDKSNSNETTLAEMSKLKIKSSGTLPSDVARLEISTDNDGKPLSLKRCILVCYVPSTSEALLRMRINKISSLSYYIGQSVVVLDFVNISDTRDGFCMVSLDFRLLNGNVIGSGTSIAFGTNKAGSSTHFVLQGESITSITSIWLYCSLGVSLPAGTMYELYGEDM
jgi:hypothetical protein